MKSKILLSAALLTIVSAPAFAGPASAKKASTKTPAPSYANYRCEELIQLDEEKIGSVIYYIRGHYDAKHDVWADYSPSSKKETAFREDFFAPVETVETFCKKNPQSTVVDAFKPRSN